MSPFNDSDARQLAARGLTIADARRQLERLATPPAATRVLRPCRVGDGIVQIPPEAEERLLARAEALRAEGRAAKFVPASGAATRMFKSLAAVRRRSELTSPDALERHASDPDVAATIRFFESLDRLPFRRLLLRHLERAGHELGRWPDVDVVPVLNAVLSRRELGYADMPKGLLPFHRYEETRTPLEEHLLEAASTIRDAEDTCRVTFSVAPAHADRFRRFIDVACSKWQDRLGVTFEVTVTTQNPSTDTLALDDAGNAVRESDGSLHFRPGGHGALLSCLSEMGGDVVFLKNIDNVVTEKGLETLVKWKRLLAGKLAEVESATHGWCRRLDDAYSPSAAREALAFLEKTFTRDLPDDPDLVRPDVVSSLLRRPIRVCGMVPNSGEPGGGPFWVADRDGVASAQIVEASQIDLDDPAQRAVVRAATHFNPVDLVVSLRDFRGHAFDLRKYVDPDAVFVSRKSIGGHPIRALEHPGLWNGAMARWHTLFVEVPADTFAPVKTVLDLLRPEHQP